MTDNPWTAPGGSAPGQGPYPAPPQAPGQPPYPPPPAGGPPPPGPAPQPPTGAPQWGAVDLQPGIIPLRRISLGDIYSGVMRLIRGNPGATVGMTLLLTLAVILPLTGLAAGLTALVDPAASPNDIEADYNAADVFSSLPSLGQIVIGVLLPLFISWVTYQAVLGRKVSMGETWQATKGRVLPGIGLALLYFAVFFVLAAVLVGLGVGAVFAAMAIDGGAGVAFGIVTVGLLVVLWLVSYCYLWTRFAFAFPALAVERLGPIAATRRSWGLTRGRRFWPVFGIRLLTVVLVGIATGILSCPLSLIGAIGQLAVGDHGTAAYVVAAVTNGVVLIFTTVITAPIMAGVDALLYVGQRIEQEGHDIELIRLSGAAPGGPTG